MAIQQAMYGAAAWSTDPAIQQAMAMAMAAAAPQVVAPPVDWNEGLDKDQLVQQVKTWQRQGEAYKASWYMFCGQQGTTNYDPNRHEAYDLQKFMHLVEAGEITPAESAAAPMVSSGGYTYDTSAEKAMLVDQVKSLQRRGEVFKQAWTDFLQQQGTSNRDPNRHDPAVLQQFLAMVEAQGLNTADDWGAAAGKGTGAGLIADNLAGATGGDQWWGGSAGGGRGKGKGKSTGSGSAGRGGMNSMAEIISAARDKLAAAKMEKELEKQLAELAAGMTGDDEWSSRYAALKSGDAAAADSSAEGARSSPY